MPKCPSCGKDEYNKTEFAVETETLLWGDGE